MHRLAIATALMLTLATAGAAKTRYYVQFSPIEGQSSYWEKGNQYLRDVQTNSTVEIVNDKSELPGQQSTVRLYVLNKSNSPINFGPENVKIEFKGAKFAKIFEYDELLGNSRRDIKRRNILASIGNAFAAQGANGYKTGSFDYSGNTSSGIHVSGTGSYSTYDPALAREQQAQANEQIKATQQAIASRENKARQALDSLIQKSTIEPGKQLGGIVAFEAPDDFTLKDDNSFVVILIKAGDDEHRLAGILKRAG